jgi:hypothetical protein
VERCAKSGEAVKKPWPTTKEGNPWPKCCLCGGPVEPWYPNCDGFGHNPEPLATSGRACDECNMKLVLPMRVLRFKRAEDYEIR